jgi:hypothetical protein
MKDIRTIVYSVFTKKVNLRGKPKWAWLSKKKHEGIQAFIDRECHIGVATNFPLDGRTETIGCDGEGRQLYRIIA